MPRRFSQAISSARRNAVKSIAIVSKRKFSGRKIGHSQSFPRKFTTDSFFSPRPSDKLKPGRSYESSDEKCPGKKAERFVRSWSTRRSYRSLRRIPGRFVNLPVDFSRVSCGFIDLLVCWLDFSSSCNAVSLLFSFYRSFFFSFFLSVYSFAVALMV